MMKVLLIQPPCVEFKRNVKRCQPPLGLAYLAASVKHRHEVKVLDSIAEGFDDEAPVDKRYIRYGLSFEKIVKRASAFRPDVVGISCPLTTQADVVYELAGAIKESLRSAVTVIGGAHPSSMPEESLRREGVDYVVIGEAEETFSALLQCLEKGMKPADLDGIGYKDGGNVIIKAKTRYISDLDRLPFPDWSAFPLERYFVISKPHGIYPERRRFLPVFSSRGCPNNCVFCSIHNLWGRNYRKRSAGNVLGEIGHLISEYGIEEIYFEDDNLTLDKKRSRDIFNGISERNFDIKWSSPNGVFIGTIDDEMLDLMKKSGCRALSFGIESGDKRMLKEVIDKHIDLDKTIPIFKKARELGIETSAFFVLGIPGETGESLVNSFNYARALPADHVLFFFATPLPGTRLSDLCRDRGIVRAEAEYKNLRSENVLLVPDGMSKREFLNKVKFERALFYLKKFFRSPGWFFGRLAARIFG